MLKNSQKFPGEIFVKKITNIPNCSPFTGEAVEAGYRDS